MLIGGSQTRGDRKERGAPHHVSDRELEGIGRQCGEIGEIVETVHDESERGAEGGRFLPSGRRAHGKEPDRGDHEHVDGHGGFPADLERLSLDGGEYAATRCYSSR